MQLFTCSFLSTKSIPLSFPDIPNAPHTKIIPKTTNNVFNVASFSSIQRRPETKRISREEIIHPCTNANNSFSFYETIKKATKSITPLTLKILKKIMKLTREQWAAWNLLISPEKASRIWVPKRNHHHHVERAGVGATIDKKRESVWCNWLWWRLNWKRLKGLDEAPRKWNAIQSPQILRFVRMGPAAIDI